MTAMQKFKFNTLPQPLDQRVEITAGNYVEFTFVVTNHSGRPVQADALVSLIDGPGTISTASWGQWVSLVGPVEHVFDSSGEFTYKVRITLPGSVPPGPYRFQLLIVGTEDPDTQVVESEIVSFTVVDAGVNIRPYLLIGLISLAVLILLIVGAVLLIKPKPHLDVKLTPPADLTVGQPATYTLNIKNVLQNPADNVSVDYSYPPTAIGAWGLVANSGVRNCNTDTAAHQVHCNLGGIGPQQPVTVTLQMVPSLFTGVITNTHSMTVTGQLNQVPAVTAVKFPRETSPVAAAQEPASVVIVPRNSAAIVDEKQTFTIWAWSNITATQPVTISYSLPAGMRYANPPCPQQSTDYYTLVCQRSLSRPDEHGGETRIDVQAYATDAAPALVQTAVLTDGLKTGLLYKPASLTMRAVNPAMLFNGLDNYVELGYDQAPKTFSIEMWVQPFSADDGQAFIGANRQVPGNVLNEFVVGYYDGSLSVNVNGRYYNLVAPKTTRRFHLAIVVENTGPSESRVWVYIDGVVQAWRDVPAQPDCGGCMVFDQALDGGQTLPWSLGQEWDPGGSGKKTSDFFHGTISEVSLWNTALTQQQVLDSMGRQPLDLATNLVGYWRMAPPANQADLKVADSGPNHYDGRRILSGWGGPEARFGNALSFNGVNDFLQASNLRLSNFTPNAQGKVEVTMAGWIYVNGIPSQQEWIMGNALPSRNIFSGQGGATAAASGALTQTVQGNLIQSQNQLLAAIQAQQALNLDPTQAQNQLQLARDNLYAGLWPLRSAAMPGNGGTNVAEPLVDQVRADALKTLGGRLDQLSGQPGLQGPVAAAIQAQSVYSVTSSLPANGSDAGSIRAGLQNELAKLDYTQKLVDVWKAAATSRVTVTGVIKSPLDPSLVPQAQARLDKVNAALKALSLPEQTLLDLARLEMAESPQLVGGIIQTRSSSQLSQAELAAAQKIQQQQAVLKQDLDQLEPWLGEQLNVNVNQSQATGGAAQPAASAAKTGAQPAGAAKTAAAQPAAQSNPTQDPALVGYWTFNDGPGSSQVRDSSKSGIAGTLKGTAALITSVPANLSKPNPFALSLDGQGTVEMTAAPADMKGNTSWTVSFWMKYQNPVKSTYSWILDIGDNKSSYAGLHWLINKAGRAEIGFTNGLQNQVDIRAYLDQWVQVTTVYDAQDMTLVSYLNGIEANRVKSPGQPNLNPAAGMRIGKAGDNFKDSENYTGLLDNLLIYNRALTAAEVTKLATGQRPITSDDQVALKYLLALRATQGMIKAEADLASAQKAAADVATAQQNVTRSQSSANQVNQAAQDAQKQDRQVKDLQAQALQAQQASGAATTPEERATASSRLITVTNQLAQARVDEYQNLLGGVIALEERETILADLSTRMETATDRSVEAAMQAYQRNNVERIIGPFLDLLLGTHTDLKSPQDAVYPAALLAAQQVLKTQADAQVDVARAELNDAIQRQNRLQNLSGAAQERQRILNLINDYLNSLQKEVTDAQQKLQDAQAQQAKDQKESTIKPVLADALARALAQQVTDQVISQLQPDSNSLIVNNPTLAESIKASLRDNLATSLDQVRLSVRLSLYFNSFYTALRLQGELAAGGDNAAVRALKTATLARLLDVNLNLLRVMNARNELLKPAVGFTDIMAQVADEAGRAASLDELLKELQSSLSNSESPLKQMVAYQQAVAQSPGGAAIPNLTGGSTTSGGATTSSGATTSTGTTSTGGATPNTGGNTPITGTTPPKTGQSTPLLAGLGGSGTTGASPSGGQAGSVITSTGALTSTQIALMQPPTNIWAGLIVTDDGHVALVAKPQGTADWTTLKDEKPLAVGQWLHYAGVIVYDASSGAVESLTLIRNGSRAIGAQPGQNAVDVRVEATNCLGFFIGGLCGGQESFNFAGLIDDVRVWNRALTSIEINSWRNLPGERLNEAAYWSFDDANTFAGTGTACPAGTACDQSKTGSYPLRVLGPLWVPVVTQPGQNTTNRQ